jgi:hypothetical protein
MLHRVAFWCLLIIPTLAALEPAQELRLSKEGTQRIVLYHGSQVDGRVVLMITESATPDNRPDAEPLERIAAMVRGGCIVAVLELPIRPRPLEKIGYSEKSWYGAISAAGARLGKADMRLVFLAPGQQLADPITITAPNGKVVHLDIAHPVGGAPAHGAIRLRSGLFGADTFFCLAEHGYATAQIPDPFYDLKLSGAEAITYAQTAASAFRSQTKTLGLSGKLVIGGKSKHGFASALMGAGSSYAGSDPASSYQAVLAMTDTYDPETRDADFIAAGIKVDGNPGTGNDSRGSPVKMVRAGGPAFYLCDAHGRTSRQCERMMEALTAAGVPYQQSWLKDKPNYVPKTNTNIVKFLDQVLGDTTR